MPPWTLSSSGVPLGDQVFAIANQDLDSLPRYDSWSLSLGVITGVLRIILSSLSTMTPPIVRTLRNVSGMFTRINVHECSIAALTRRIHELERVSHTLWLEAFPDLPSPYVNTSVDV